MTEKRLTGSFYTDDSVAEYLAAWAVRGPEDSILEPSFGNGVFIDRVLEQFKNIGIDKPEIYGVELQRKSFEKYKSSDKTAKIHGFCQDFMLFDEKISVSAVIGNPPYVRLRNLSARARLNAIEAVEEQNVEMMPSGSLWMAFVIQAARFLKNGGRIGFVLPFEITYVKYACPLWEFLKGKFGKISIYRVHEDLFPDVDVETVLFLAEGFGGTTDYVEYYLYETCKSLSANAPLKYERVMIDCIIEGKKPFVWALLEDQQRELLKMYQKRGSIVPISEMCKFRIGYVCADKDFFHPSQDIIQAYDIPQCNLLACISNAKAINGGRQIGVVVEDGQCDDKLYVPAHLSDGDKKYIAYGETKGVHKRYKCRIRKPWYITPSVKKADLILTVFGDIPKLLGNAGSYVVSNSLLSGVLTDKTTAKEIVCRWYNSLTLLSVELNIHSLGGGVLVFIPGETDKIEVIKDFPANMVEDTISAFDSSMLQDGLENTYFLGDEIVLKKIVGFSSSDILTIREALAVLRYWRRPECRRNKKKEEEKDSPIRKHFERGYTK